ncbi:MAG: hypothetical protein KC432_10355, partial [Thermomicrobiales bacterium]|nr:hypothetical protein [Thermomicrobiales bacterium]
MNWLSQNWPWLLLTAGILLLLRRGGAGSCGHAHGRHGQRHDRHGNAQTGPESRSSVVTDPVTGES